MLTQERLRGLLRYDPETGVFTSLVNRGPLAPGDVVGTPHHSGYKQIRVDGRIYLAHRLAWLYVHGEFPPGDIDHINRNKQDNRIVNLRPATRSENNFNAPVRRHNVAGIKGVRRTKNGSRWEARARIAGHERSLGTYDTPEEASAAYQSFARHHHGEFYHPQTRPSETTP